MEFRLGEQHEMVRSAIREVVDRVIAPRAAHHDETGEFPWENVRALAEGGFLGLSVPERYGGFGGDKLANTIVLEEVSRGCAATGTILDVQNCLVADPILRWGTEEQRQRYLPPLAEGRLIGAYALTEQQSGSDAGTQRTRAVRDGDGYVLNGEKTFITNGGVAGFYIVYAATNPEAGARGISAFLVPADAPGFSAGPPEKKMGIRASATTTLTLQDVRVPEENRLGAEGEGYKIALATLDVGRVGIAAQAIGITQAALDDSVKFSRERIAFGRPIAEFQAIQWKIAEMATDLEAARLLAYRAAWLLDQPGRHSKECSMAKLFASTMAMRHTVQAVQIHGGYGYMREYRVERLMRDAKITEIYEGTSEIQHLVIARSVLD